MNIQQPFFVTGLPRSRTAWLANWLTTDKTLCLHDVPFDASRLRVDRRIGFAGPELVWQMKDISEQFPAAPWMIIMRDPDECMESWKRVAGSLLPTGGDFYRLWKKRLALLEDLDSLPRNTKIISFEEIDEEPFCRNLTAHLGIPFDVDRWNLLTEFNIQQKFDVAMAHRKEQWQPLAQSPQ